MSIYSQPLCFCKWCFIESHIHSFMNCHLWIIYYLWVIYGCFHAIIIELSSCYRGYVAQKAKYLLTGPLQKMLGNPYSIYNKEHSVFITVGSTYQKVMSQTLREKLGKDCGNYSYREINYNEITLSNFLLFMCILLLEWHFYLCSGLLMVFKVWSK